VSLTVAQQKATRGLLVGSVAQPADDVFQIAPLKQSDSCNTCRSARKA